ncbi:MAG TPA: hypothetical protein VI755_16040 [Anaerolineales bacterium]|nr:hypothetical protein [Anaerolineales bacterium]
MRNRLIFLTPITLLATLGLGACNLSAPTTPTQADLPAAYTAAAETIVAQLTQIAQTLTPTAPGGPLPSASETGIPATEGSPTQVTDTPPPTETESPATPTASAISQATSTDTPSATATIPATDPKASLGDPDFEDSFANDSNWPLYEDDHVSFDVDGGQLIMVAFNPDFWDGFMLSWAQVEDFYLEMTATSRQCAGLDHHGLMARANQSERGYIGYQLGISCDGRYSLRIWDGKKHIKLIDWTESEHLRAGSNQTNRIGLLLDGERLSLFANGNLLDEISADAFEDGKFGVFIGSVNTEDFKVRVDEIAYWSLP